MAKIPLRQYNRDIENLIDRGQTEEAIAHCKLILQSYPKHLETYRLLGKALLESQRYGEAADIFQRILSSIPDDFVSQIGMSIIREDEGNLDAAIWHMERAYEVQPSNAAVQGELRRLYGRRDGLEPPKIRLTRGALVRLYARGDLYQQAIAEIRSAQAEDPNRPDLQVILARMFFQTGQKVEAADICSTLLNRLPYCYDANKILADILPETSRADDAPQYKQRLVSMDPYVAGMAPGMNNALDVPDQAVLVDQLDWDPLQGAEPGPSRWASSLGLDIDSSSSNQLPDWLTPGEVEVNLDLPEEKKGGHAEVFTVEDTTFAPEEPTPAPATPPEPEESDSLIPDWMRQAGWAPSELSAEQTPPVSDTFFGEMDRPSSDAEAEAIPADYIPDWMREIAPTPDQLSQELAKGDEDESPAQAFSMADEEKSPDTEQPGGEEDLEDWLGPILGAPAEHAAPAEGVPDWLSELSQTAEPAAEQPPADQPTTDSGRLDYVWSAEKDQAPLPEEIQPPAESEPTQEPEDTPPLPNLMHATAILPGIITSDGENIDLPDWLRDIGQEADQESPAIPATPAGQTPEPPFTPVQPFQDNEPPSGPAVFEEQNLNQWKPEMTPFSSEGQTTGGESTGSALSWLETLAAQQGADQGLLDNAPSGEEVAPPDWIQAMMKSAEEGAPISEEAPQPGGENETPAAGAGLEEDPSAEKTVQKPGSDQDWLESLASAHLSEAKTVAARRDRPLQPPDWLNEHDTGALTSEERAAQPPQPEIPSWVEDLQAGPAAKQPSAGEDLPEWLASLTADSASETEPSPAPQSQPAAETELPAWLFSQEEAEPASPAEPEPSAEPPASIPEELPDWLNEITREEPQPPAPFSDEPDAGALQAPPEDQLQPAEASAETEAVEQTPPTPPAVEPVSPAQPPEAERGDPLADVRDLRAALEQQPDDAELWGKLGDAYAKAGRPQDALDAYTRAEQLLG